MATIIGHHADTSNCYTPGCTRMVTKTDTPTVNADTFANEYATQQTQKDLKMLDGALDRAFGFAHPKPNTPAITITEAINTINAVRNTRELIQTLNRVMDDLDNRGQHRLIAAATASPHADAQTLITILKYPTGSQAVANAATNPNLDATNLTKAYEATLDYAWQWPHEPRGYIWSKFTQNPNINPDTLDIIARNQSAASDEAIAEHPLTSEKTLKYLMQNRRSNSWAGNRARNRLEEIKEQKKTTAKVAPVTT